MGGGVSGNGFEERRERRLGGLSRDAVERGLHVGRGERSAIGELQPATQRERELRLRVVHVPPGCKPGTRFVRTRIEVDEWSEEHLRDRDFLRIIGLRRVEGLQPDRRDPERASPTGRVGTRGRRAGTTCEADHEHGQYGCDNTAHQIAGLSSAK